MSLDMNWLDELDEDELEVDPLEDDGLGDEAVPLEHIEFSDDGLDMPGAELEPEEVADEGGVDVVVQYFQESARHHLLSAGQEKELALAVERGRLAEKKLAHPRRALSETDPRFRPPLPAGGASVLGGFVAEIRTAFHGPLICNQRSSR